MKSTNTADCFQVDRYYYYSSSKSSLCEGYASNDHAYITSFSALFIILTAFYSLFFHRHNLSLLRFISSSLMLNGIASFLNHWYGTRDWLFIDNVSFILSSYLLLLLCVYTFITNYEQLLSAPASDDNRTPVSPVNAMYPASPRSMSLVPDIDYAHQMTFGNVNSPERSASLVVETKSTLISATRSKISISILCFVVMCLLIYSNMIGCGWKVNTNDLFIVFTLIAPLIILCSLMLFYWKSKQNDNHLGTLCHSSYTADLVFGCYARGVIAICCGNLLRIISETVCNKHLPGHLLYNVFSFYGYSLISIYIMYLSNDIQGRPCFFQTMGERHLSIVFIWFHWLFPSLVCAVADKNKADVPDLLRENTLQLGSLPMDMDVSMDMDPDLLPQKDDDMFETYSVFLQHWHHSDGQIISSECKQMNEKEALKPITLQTTQIRVMQQNEGDQSCGYYALFFVSKLSQILAKLTTLHGNYVSPSIVALMQELRSKQSFESFKRAIMNDLVRQCEALNTDDYPWSATHVTASGILERAYLQFLQNNDYLFDVINLLEFSHVSLMHNRLPLKSLHELEYLFNDRFATQREDYKIFLIGSAIHYVVCAVFRTHDHIDILYLDSQNEDILFKSPSVLAQQIDVMPFTSWCAHGWHLNDMKRLAKDSIKGIQFVVTELLNKAVCNLYSTQYNPYLMRDMLVQLNVMTGFLGSFTAHVLQPIMDYISDETCAAMKHVQLSPQMAPSTAAAGWYVFGVNSLQSLSLRDELKGCQCSEFNQKDCQLVIRFVKQKIARNADIGECSALVRAWISSYYPPAIIESNIVNVLDHIPHHVLQSLSQWRELMMLFASNAKDDVLFWRRLSTTLRSVASMNVDYVADMKELSLVLRDVTNMREDVCLMICLFTYHPNQAYYDNHYRALKHCLLHLDADDTILQLVMAFLPTNIKFGEAENQFKLRMTEEALFIANNDDFDRITIHCYVMAESSEIWLGLVDKNTMQMKRDIDRNDLLQLSTVHAFGSGNWISFVIWVNNDAFKYDVKICTKDGDEQCIYQNAIESSPSNAMYFVCLIKDADDNEIFIEKGMTL